MKVNDISILIGGEAGAGITRSGYLLAKACIRGGLNVFGANDYQSLIRGGHNFYVLNIKAEEVYSQAGRTDLLVALNDETITRHRDRMISGGAIIYDGDNANLSPKILNREDVRLYGVPLKKIVKEELEGQILMRNTVAIGAVFALVNYDLELLEGVLKDTFKPKIAEANIKAANKGYDYLKSSFEDDFGYRLRRIEKDPKQKIFPTGNEAVGLGAISAGCKFYVAYPMTPSTGVLHFMAANQRKYDMLVLQPEGEIAAMNMAAGAAFAGVRAMTSTSGGGFCLMSEALGMAAMTETPAVVMVSQRTGPSTGLPTYTAQGDLRFVIHASQGEFPRVVIAPGDAEECYYETMRAFNWAEKYQIPVILLTDKYLSESQTSVQPFNSNEVKVERGELITDEYNGDEEYKRHRITETGISPRAIPLTRGAIVRTNADEHGEYGLTTEDPEITTKMIDKRMRKLTYLAKELEERDIKTTKLYGPRDSQATVISWGSTKGPIRETLKLLGKEKINVNFLQILYILPFPAAKVDEILNQAKKTIVIENNKTSQLSTLIREHLLRDVDHRILKYDGRPFDPDYLSQKIKEVL